MTNRIQAATDRFCKLLETQLRLPEKGPGDGAHYFASAGKTTANAVAKALATEPLVSEPAIAADLIELLPDGWGAFGGSSMPIRDLDAYAKTTSPRTSPLAVGSNRGASGIDGAIASAVGFAAGLQTPVGALVGDLSVLHALGSLAILARSPLPVVVVIVNNNGGGIFGFLPALTSQEDVFEDCFGARHDYRFEHACQMFGLDYHQPKTRAAARETMQQCFAVGRSAIIEVITNREENLALHRKLCDEVGSAIETQVQKGI